MGFPPCSCCSNVFQRSGNSKFIYKPVIVFIIESAFNEFRFKAMIEFICDVLGGLLVHWSGFVCYNFHNNSDG